MKRIGNLESNKTYNPRNVKPQSVCENAADSQHFPWVHGSGAPADIHTFDTDGPYLRTVMSLGFGGNCRFDCRVSSARVNLYSATCISPEAL